MTGEVTELRHAQRILVVEDDAKLCRLITGALERYGFRPLVIRDFARVRDEFVELKPDLVILDINLPYYDGFFWCRQIRAVSQVPVIFLSARTGDTDQVFAMENGGDDYVTKPFSLEVLVAKVRSVLRRVYGEYAAGGAGQGAGAGPGAGQLLSVGGLVLDGSRGEVVFGGRRVPLSRTEFRLLHRLASQPGQIVPREDLLEELWDDITFVDDNTLTVNVSRVRRKLAELGFPGGIATRRGHGYLLALAEDGEPS